MAPRLAQFLERVDDRRLGVCPQCGQGVAPSADALRYEGEFHHIACALMRRRRTRRHALAGLPRSG